MTHLLQSASSASTASNLLLPALAETSTRAAFFSDQRLIAQTVLRLAEPVAIGQEPLAIESIPVTVLKPLHQLVTAVAQLEWPEDGSSGAASETLPPAVLAAAEAMLAALPTVQQPRAMLAARQLDWPPSLWQTHFWLQTLAPWLLWGIARSAHPVMQLMEGVPAAVLRPDSGRQSDWQPGVLRLVALLSVSGPESSCSIDLATCQTSLDRLSTDSQLQLPDSLLEPQLITVAELLQRLTQQVQTTTPALHPFFAGLPAEILVPNQAWQSSLVQLGLAVEFIPADVASWLQDECAPAIATSSSRIQFTNPAWLDQYKLTIAQQQLTALLPHLAAEWSQSAAARPERLVELIRAARVAADGLHTSLALASRNCLQQDLSLEELMRSLLWSFSHSAFEVMQLMSGIRTQLLQPQQGWVSGSLRFLVQLHLQTLETQWHFDIITRQLLQAPLRSAAPDAIVHSEDCRWCQQPNLLANLETTLWQRIQAATPELRLLLAGTDIAVQQSNAQAQESVSWQPARFHLSTSFEFTPDPNGI